MSYPKQTPPWWKFPKPTPITKRTVLVAYQYYNSPFNHRGSAVVMEIGAKEDFINLSELSKLVKAKDDYYQPERDTLEVIGYSAWKRGANTSYKKR